jgi:hypothetical protein
MVYRWGSAVGQSVNYLFHDVSCLRPRRLGRSFVKSLFPILLFSLSACVQSANPESTPEPQKTTSREKTATQVNEGVSATPVAPESKSPTQTSSPAPVVNTPTATVIASATPSTSKDDLSITAGDISLYPVTRIFAGDLVTIRIDPTIPKGLAPNDVNVRIFLDGEQIVSDNINWRSLDGQPYGLYQWVWDTEKQPGYHTVIVFLDPEDLITVGDESPDNNVASLTVAVAPSEGLPELEVSASWVAAENVCCRVHVISGTAAHRDLSQLLEQIDVAFRNASESLSESLSDRFDVFLIDRIIGQGGYAQNSMVVSYLDRDYIAGGLNVLLMHEAVHLIDSTMTSNPITFLSEGLATWIAGGHYRKQELEQRMAALVEIRRYRPLHQTIDDFYGTQHEVAYLEGAAFIDYLVKTYGWEQVKAFYIEADSSDGVTLSRAVDLNLQLFFGLSLEQVEVEWIAHLEELPRDREEMDDLQTTLRYYDVVRRYQIANDPSAFYLTTWLPSPEDALMAGATADFSRRPETPANVALETLLRSAGISLREGDYARANALLDSVIRVLSNSGAFLDPLALSYLNVVLAAAEMGYEAQQIDVLGNRAIVHGTEAGDPSLNQIILTLSEGRKWILVR